MKHATHLHLEQVKFKNAWSFWYVLPISFGVGVANSVQWLSYGLYGWGFDFWQGQKLSSFPGCLLLSAGTTASFASGEGLGLEADHSSACKTEDKNTWSCTLTVVLMFVVLYWMTLFSHMICLINLWCLMLQVRYNLIFHLCLTVHLLNLRWCTDHPGWHFFWSFSFHPEGYQSSSFRYGMSFCFTVCNSLAYSISDD